MKELSAIKYEVRKSRFFAHLYLIESEDDIAAINGIQRELYKKAAHHCYAARYPSGNSGSTAFGNDGEVGRPGRVLLDILVQKNLGSHCLAVSRVFGGIKLGPAGVSRDFRDAGKAAVEHYLESGSFSGDSS